MPQKPSLMNTVRFPVELLKERYAIEEGKVYHGNFACDGSPHKAVVFFVSAVSAYMFCISSRERTMKWFAKTDCPAAVVEISAEEARELFPTDTKRSFIYCGLKNCRKIPIAQMLEGLADGTVSFVRKASDALMADIRAAVQHSQSYSPDDLAELGL